jgi:hypothetical protein
MKWIPVRGIVIGCLRVRIGVGREGRMLRIRGMCWLLQGESGRGVEGALRREVDGVRHWEIGLAW